ERGLLRHLVVRSEVVGGEAEVAHAGDGEHAGDDLPELGGDRVGDGDPGNVERAVVLREVASHPAGPGEGTQAERVGGPPDSDLNAASFAIWSSGAKSSEGKPKSRTRGMASTLVTTCRNSAATESETVTPGMSSAP